jgi:hypothetical protein
MTSKRRKLTQDDKFKLSRAIGFTESILHRLDIMLSYSHVIPADWSDMSYKIKVVGQIIEELQRRDK